MDREEYLIALEDSERCPHCASRYCPAYRQGRGQPCAGITCDGCQQAFPYSDLTQPGTDGSPVYCSRCLPQACQECGSRDPVNDPYAGLCAACWLRLYGPSVGNDEE